MKHVAVKVLVSMSGFLIDLLSTAHTTTSDDLPVAARGPGPGGTCAPAEKGRATAVPPQSKNSGAATAIFVVWSQQFSNVAAERAAIFSKEECGARKNVCTRVHVNTC